VAVAKVDLLLLGLMLIILLGLSSTTRALWPYGQSVSCSSSDSDDTTELKRYRGSTGKVNPFACYNYYFYTYSHSEEYK